MEGRVELDVFVYVCWFGDPSMDERMAEEVSGMPLHRIPKWHVRT